MTAKRWSYSLLLVLALLVALALSGCYTKQQAMRKFCTPSQEIVKDSSSRTSNVKSSRSSLLTDSVYVIPKSEILTSFNPCDSLGRVIQGLNIKLQSGTGTLTIKSDSQGNIQVGAECEEAISRLKREIEKRDSIAESVDSKSSFHQVIPPTAYQIPNYIWYIIAMLALLALPTLFRLAKLFAKFS